jgi:hypothetical protein
MAGRAGGAQNVGTEEAPHGKIMHGLGLAGQCSDGQGTLWAKKDGGMHVVCVIEGERGK